MKHFFCVLLVVCCLFTPATAAVLPASAPTDATLPKNAPGYTPTDKALSSLLAEVPYTEEENKKETK